MTAMCRSSSISKRPDIERARASKPLYSNRLSRWTNLYQIISFPTYLLANPVRLISQDELILSQIAQRNVNEREAAEPRSSCNIDGHAYLTCSICFRGSRQSTFGEGSWTSAFHRRPAENLGKTAKSREHWRDLAVRSEN
jgi:hypothetical protein